MRKNESSRTPAVRQVAENEVLALRAKGRDRTFIFTTPKHSVKKHAKRYTGPLLASILGWRPGVSMHLGVIFIFPVMYLMKRELGELIPSKIKRRFIVQKASEEEESHPGGALLNCVGGGISFGIQSAGHGLGPSLRDSVMVTIWSTAGM